MLSPTYKQRNEDFRKLFSKLPEAERLIVGESDAHLVLDLTLSSQLCPSDPPRLGARQASRVTRVSVRPSLPGRLRLLLCLAA